MRERGKVKESERARERERERVIFRALATHTEIVCGFTYSGRDCVQSLRSSFTEVYPQSVLSILAMSLRDRNLLQCSMCWCPVAMDTIMVPQKHANIATSLRNKTLSAHYNIIRPQQCVQSIASGQKDTHLHCFDMTRNSNDNNDNIDNSAYKLDQ